MGQSAQAPRGKFHDRLCTSDLNLGMARTVDMRQLSLDLRRTKRGGARKGAGRKAAPHRKGFVEHVARPAHDDETPVHVTVRAVGSVPFLRSQIVFAAIRALFARASIKGLRLLHFSVQGNHLHMIVEADEGLALSRGMQRLLSRLAMTINAVANSHGKVWRDRYHRRDLTTPQQFRNALVYVLFNIRKHALNGNDVELWSDTLDPCSSAAWFTGWAPRAGPSAAVVTRAGPSIVARPRSWLARQGWERRGLLRCDERVGGAA
jgi:putative transposase